MSARCGAGGGAGHCEWAAALERVCPFRQVSKTVGQKTVWQLFNTIEYEVWQRQRSQSRHRREATEKSCSAWQIMKNTPTSQCFLAVCTRTHPAHTRAHTKTNRGSNSHAVHTHTQSQHFRTLFRSCRCCCCCCCAVAAAWQFFGDKIFKFN